MSLSGNSSSGQKTLSNTQQVLADNVEVTSITCDEISVSGDATIASSLTVDGDCTIGTNDENILTINSYIENDQVQWLETCTRKITYDGSEDITTITGSVNLNDYIKFTTRDEFITMTYPVYVITELRVSDVSWLSNVRCNDISANKLTVSGVIINTGVQQLRTDCSSVMVGVTTLQNRATWLETDASLCAGRLSYLEADASLCAGRLSFLEADASLCAGRLTFLEADASLCAGRLNFLEADASLCAGRLTFLEADASLCAGRLKFLEADASLCAGRLTFLEADASLCAGRLNFLERDASDYSSRLVFLEKDASDYAGRLVKLEGKTQYQGTAAGGTFFTSNVTALTVCSSGNLLVGSLTTSPETKGGTALARCHTVGTEIADASNSFPNLALGANSQNGYVCNGSSGTFYKAFGQGDPANSWWQSSSTYSPSGSPSSSVYLVYNGGTSLGEWISITVPGGTLIKPTQMWVYDNMGPAYTYTFAQCRVYGQLNGGQLQLIGSETIAGNPPPDGYQNITLSGTSPFNTFYFQVTQMSNWAGGGVNLPASVSNIFIAGYTANYTISQAVYFPQSVEIGKTAITTLPTNQLRVNGSCRVDNLFTNQLNVDSSSVFVGTVYCKSNFYGTTGDMLGPYSLSGLWFKEVTGIPSWATEIVVVLTTIKNSAGTGLVYLTLGNSDGTYSGSYQGSSFGSSTSALDSTYVHLSPDSTWATAATYYGQYVFKFGGTTSLAEPKAIWGYTGIMTRADGGSWWQANSGGIAFVKSTTYVDRVKITHPSSTTPFDTNAYMTVTFR